MSNYVIRVYGAKIAGSYQLQKEEGFIDFNTEFFKKHKPLKKRPILFSLVNAGLPKSISKPIRELVVSFAIIERMIRPIAYHSKMEHCSCRIWAKNILEINAIVLDCTRSN